MTPVACVAPLAGAWIETIQVGYLGRKIFVAPLAGAWIETWKLLDLSSHQSVAPLAGAWIETLFHLLHMITS